jgi:hypothetical protein
MRDIGFSTTGTDRFCLARKQTREYFGTLPAEIARAVPESVINCIACIIFDAHRTGRREAYTYLKEFVLEKLEVPDWPLDPMPKLARMTPPPLPPDC